MKYIHKTYTLFTRLEGGGGAATYIYQKLFEAGCVGTLHYVSWYILRRHYKGNLRDLQHEGKEVT